MRAALSGETSWICAGCRSRLQQRSLADTRDRTPRTTLRLLGKSHRHDQPRQRQWLSTSPRSDAVSTRSVRLPEGPARTRFAPSPTGYLHIGGLRTALFSYLLAKRTQGSFILRIEDTDQKRLVPDAEARILEDLTWAGLCWDEGPDTPGEFGPYKQSLRLEIYQKHASDLLDAGQAYRCFCMPQTVGEAKSAYVTSGCYQNCASLPQEQSEEKAADSGHRFTVRLRQAPDAYKRVYPDLVYGNIQRLKRSPSAPLSASEDDTSVDASDTILVKSDGTPTYHFANVVDDHLMNITHVIRGSEWMASTPLHYDIYSAFNWTPPQFAHVGLLVDQNKAKLSKRNSDLALDVASMRDKHGVLSTPLINFLALLGWSNPTNNDVMELDGLVKNFDLKFTRGNAMVRTEKLWFLQKTHVAKQCEKAEATGCLDPLAPVVIQIVKQVQAVHPQPCLNRQLVPDSVTDAYALGAYSTAILLADSKSFQNAAQFVERDRYFFAFDASQVPAEQEFYDKARTLTPEHMRDLLGRVFQLRWGTSSSEERQLSDPRSLFAATEKHIRLALALATWHLVLHPDHVDFDARNALSRIPNLLRLAYTRVEGEARHLLGTDATDERVEMLVKRYKAISGAAMKFSREKLSLGLPGPHISAVMAILGREECAKRLGIEEKGK